jgi:hypothetical protein
MFSSAQIDPQTAENAGVAVKSKMWWKKSLQAEGTLSLDTGRQGTKHSWWLRECAEEEWFGDFLVNKASCLHHYPPTSCLTEATS